MKIASALISAAIAAASANAAEQWQQTQQNPWLTPQQSTQSQGAANPWSSQWNNSNATQQRYPSYSPWTPPTPPAQEPFETGDEIEWKKSQQLGWDPLVNQF